MTIFWQTFSQNCHLYFENGWFWLLNKFNSWCPFIFYWWLVIVVVSPCLRKEVNHDEELTLQGLSYFRLHGSWKNVFFSDCQNEVWNVAMVIFEYHIFWILPFPPLNCSLTCPLTHATPSTNACIRMKFLHGAQFNQVKPAKNTLKFTLPASKNRREEQTNDRVNP